MNTCKRFPVVDRGEFQGGMVLVAVLWVVMALTIIVTGITRAVRDEARMLSIARQGVEAYALGDAAIHMVLQEMVAQSQPVDRLTNVRAVFHGLPLDVEIMPLNGLIDVNAASMPLLTSLFAVAGGVPEDAAQNFAKMIEDYRMKKKSQVNSWRFDSKEDLLSVPGLGYDIYAKISDLITADLSGGGLVNPMAAPRSVLVVLAGGNVQLADQIASRRDSGEKGVDTTGLFADFIGSGSVRRYRLQARVPKSDGSAVLVSRYVDVGSRERDGLPWFTFQLHRDVLPSER